MSSIFRIDKCSILKFHVVHVLEHIDLHFLSRRKDRSDSSLSFYNYSRKDLANIVRRRGYKLLEELLTNITKQEAVVLRNNDEIQDTSNGCGNDSSGLLCLHLYWLQLFFFSFFFNSFIVLDSLIRL